MKQEQENFKSRMIKVWDKVAPTFGKVGPKYWDYFGRRLVEYASINNDAKVLDIGMGRGSSLFPASEKVGKNGSVIGIDMSEVMVNETYQEVCKRNIKNIELMKMDAERLDFADDFFNNILCGFCISYLLYSSNKLNGVLRVLKEGGQAGFSIWGIQEDTEWITGLFKKYLPQKSSPKKTVQANMPKFDTSKDVRKILEDAGFRNIKIFEEDKVFVYKNKEEWWQEMWSNAARRILEQIKESDVSKLEEFKVDAFAGLENYSRGDGIHIKRSVIYAFGEK